jgi:pilus assembly protein CpaC
VLGDIPVLGALFRSVRYQRKETELVVLVTPRLVEAMNPGQTPPSPGAAWRHPSESDLFLKADLGGPVPPELRPTTQPTAAVAQPPRFFGQYGYQPAAYKR